MGPQFFGNWKIDRASPWFQALFPGISIALCLAIAVVSWFQPDSAAVLLLFPRWIWPAPGLLLAVLGWTRRRRRVAVIASILWFVYAGVFVDELGGLLRSQSWSSPHWLAARTNALEFRVVSLNCAGGSEEAAAEVASYQPDIVLFQESPLRPKLRGMLSKLVGPEGESLCGPDVSIIARGKLTPVPLPVPWDVPFSHARVQLPSGISVEVIVVRLHPYKIRADLWSPECWREQHAQRLQQREQLGWLVKYIETIPRDVPLIVGGDFNLPAYDRMLDVLRPRLEDTFREQGAGWGDTLDNDVPFLRIDQIWTSKHFQASAVVARRTANSDHRMVVCDLVPGQRE